MNPTKQRDQEIDKLKCYLDELVAEGTISASSAAKYFEEWNKLQRAISQLPIPDACPGLNNDLLYTWDYKQHHFECELFANGKVCYYYKNRETKEQWYKESMVHVPISEEVVEKLSTMYKSDPTSKK